MPEENGNLLIYSSTQHPSEVQHAVAKATATSANAVTVQCRRMGGAFGGKESQPALFACVCAVSANKTRRPVKLRLDRDIDMIVLFGDGRPMHRAAVEIATRLGLRLQVVEEGYLRPNFITVEADGVNGYSKMSREPTFYREYNAVLPPDTEPSSENHFIIGSYYAIIYALVTWFGSPFYPRYKHHRPINPWAQMFQHFNTGRVTDVCSNPVRLSLGRRLWIQLNHYDTRFHFFLQLFSNALACGAKAYDHDMAT